MHGKILTQVNTCGIAGSLKFRKWSQSEFDSLCRFVFFRVLFRWLQLTEPMTSFRTTYNSTYDAAVHVKTGRSNVERSSKSVQSSLETTLGKRGGTE